MTAHARDTTAPAGRRRADAGVLHLSQRDIDGLLLCGEHSGVPFDLLATALRWSRSGYPRSRPGGGGPGLRRRRGWGRDRNGAG